MAWSVAPSSALADADALIASHARNWRIERMAVIDRLVLRLAIYELLAEPPTPAKVVINEALELARTFSGEEAVPFVNGVLDAVRKTLGKDDLQPRKAGCGSRSAESGRESALRDRFPDPVPVSGSRQGS